MATPSAHRPEDFLPLHPVELRILLVLAEGPAHGYPIIRVIEDRDGFWKRVLQTNLNRRAPRHARAGAGSGGGAPEGMPDEERQRRTFALTELRRRGAVAEARCLDALTADAKRVLREV